MEVGCVKINLDVFRVLFKKKNWRDFFYNEIRSMKVF